MLDGRFMGDAQLLRGVAELFLVSETGLRSQLAAALSRSDGKEISRARLTASWDRWEISGPRKPWRWRESWSSWVSGTICPGQGKFLTRWFKALMTCGSNSMERWRHIGPGRLTRRHGHEVTSRPAPPCESRLARSGAPHTRAGRPSSRHRSASENQRRRVSARADPSGNEQPSRE